MELAITQLDFIIKPKNRIMIPKHPGSTLRGAFGQGLYNIVCSLKDIKCKECNLKHNCPYSVLFNPFLNEKEKQNSSTRFNNKPRPFVFSSESNKEVYNSSEYIKFQMTLFGYTNKFVPYILESWRKLEDEGIGSNRGKYKLAEVWLTNDIKGKSERIYSVHNDTIKNKNLNITSQDIKNEAKYYLEKKELNISFISPILLRYRKRYVKKIKFNIMMRNLFRRLSSLSFFYGNRGLEINFSEYLDKAKYVKLKIDNTEWQQWYRYSNRQNRKIDMQGLTGKITYEGDISDFIEYLIYGQYIHVGKNTVFGQGKYIIL